MESINRLLAELKAEYQASQKQADDLKSQPLVQAQAPLKPAAVPSNPTFKTLDIDLYAGALDKDLAEIKQELRTRPKKPGCFTKILRCTGRFGKKPGFCTHLRKSY